MFVCERNKKIRKIVLLIEKIKIESKKYVIFFFFSFEGERWEHSFDFFKKKFF